jgi:hypothetical protein
LIWEFMAHMVSSAGTNSLSVRAQHRPELLSTPAACQACVERLDDDYRLAGDVVRQVYELHQPVLHSLQSFLEAWGMQRLAHRA